jgi:hypothetical protein
VMYLISHSVIAFMRRHIFPHTVTYVANNRAIVFGLGWRNRMKLVACRGVAYYSSESRNWTNLTLNCCGMLFIEFLQFYVCPRKKCNWSYNVQATKLHLWKKKCY